METGLDLEGYTAAFSLRFALLAFGILLLLLFVAIVLKQPREQAKRMLFGTIVGLVAATTVVLAGLTIYLNTISWSNGPVHWHADFEVWACGQELNLIDPQGLLSNKTGTPSRHEHNDKRLHYEGVVVAREDASLSKFFTALGATLTSSELVFPTNEGDMKYAAGTTCPDGSMGLVQVFVYKVGSDQTYSQKRVLPEQYIMSPHAQVPPGDCLIVEFGSLKDRTNKLCQSFEAAKEIGKLKGEVDGRH